MKRLAVVSLFASSVALAEPPPPLDATAAEPELITQSILPNLFATSLGTTIEVRLDYSDIDQIDLTVLNTLAHVQYLTPQGFGGYLRVPFGYVEDGGDAGVFDGAKGIGNIEVGGLYVMKSGPNTDVLGRAGVAIDTADEDDAIATSLSTILPRLIDTYASGLETTWARGQVQLRHAANNLRFGAALGMDVPIAGEGADQDGFVGVVSGVLAAGLQQGQLGLGLSFVMVQPITDDDDENLTGLNLGIDYLMNPAARLFFQIGVSLEDQADGTAFGIGVRASF